MLSMQGTPQSMVLQMFNHIDEAEKPQRTKATTSYHTNSSYPITHLRKRDQRKRRNRPRAPATPNFNFQAPQVSASPRQASQALTLQRQASDFRPLTIQFPPLAHPHIRIVLQEIKETVRYVEKTGLFKLDQRQLMEATHRRGHYMAWRRKYFRYSSQISIINSSISVIIAG